MYPVRENGRGREFIRKAKMSITDLEAADGAAETRPQEVGAADDGRVRSFLPSPFIAASLPLRSVKATNFTRSYNNIKLTLTSASRIPFGKYGRLLLTILTTHAVLSEGDGQVEVNYSKLGQLLDEMELPRSRGGKIQEQLENFSKTSFIFEEAIETTTQKILFKEYCERGEYTGGRVRVRKVSSGNIRFMSGFQYIQLDDGVRENAKNISFRIMLSDEFVRFSKGHAVPVDYTVYKSIGSDVGKDLYAWLIYRNNALTSPLFIPRQSLINQFMPVYDKSKKGNEKANYLYIIDQIRMIERSYYRELRVDISPDGSGITLHRSPTPVVSSDRHYVLVTSNL